MGKTIWIKTTRHSALFRAILRTYSTGTTIRIDGRTYGEDDIENLLETWCTNSRIRATRDFALARDGRVLFSFHDSPDHVWAAYSELEFIQQLRAQKIARFTVVLPSEPHERKPLLDKLLDRLAKITARRRR